jgi:tRNA G46 methylase TrmB
LHANSRPVKSNQSHLHPRLAQVVLRHLQTRHLDPIAEQSRQAYAVLADSMKAQPRPLVLDSFCGTGHSTALLAGRHPEHLVVGIDKSAARLARHPAAAHENYLLLQARCEDIWRLLVEDGLQANYHYLLYPNPWPKSRHLQRRIHGHGAFPLLHQLGGFLEVRSNWLIYVEEFGSAMHIAGHPGRVALITDTAPALSLFEQKYRQSGHLLWSYTARITP